MISDVMTSGSVPFADICMSVHVSIFEPFTHAM